MDKTYGQAYRRLYEQHWWWRSRRAVILEVLQRILPRDRLARILDVGCGDALFFDDLRRLGDPEGVEVDADLVREDNPWRDHIYIGPFDTFQPQHVYSAILMLDVLEHMDDPQSALAHALDALEDDGHLVVTVPAFLHLWTSHDDLNHHFTRYSRSALKGLAEQVGAVWLESRYLFQWLYFAKLGVRAREAMLGANPRPPRIPVRLVNELCKTLCDWEQANLLRLPFGSSLLAVLGKAAGKELPASCDASDRRHSCVPLA